MARTLVNALLVVTIVHGTAAADRERDPEPWRKAFFASLALTVSTGVIWGLSITTLHSEADQIEATKANGDSITQDDCGDRRGISNDVDGHFASACSWRSVSRTAAVFTVGFGVATIASAVFAFRGGDDAAPSSNVSITPTISREGAGAQLRLRW